MAAILTLFVCPVALHIVIAHPGAVNGNHRFPARCPREFGVSHSSDDIEVSFDKILPGLPLVDAFFLDTESLVHLKGVNAVKNPSAITDNGLGDTS
jgi:hypothetical protein